MSLDRFAVDQSLAEEGTWVDLGDGGQWKILPSGVENRKLAKVSERVFRPLRKLIAARMIDDARMREALAEVYAEAIVVDFKGVIAKGQPLTFSRAEVKRILMDYPRLFDELRALAEDTATFQREDLDADLGN